MEITSKYLAEAMALSQTGNAREHAYRPAFSQFMKLLRPELQGVNDPKRSEHGAPDFVFLKGDMTIGYVETKDINIDLDKVEKSEQMERYFGYSNLILTNYLEFRFFRNGERYCEPISIGIFSGNVIVPKQENAELLERTIKDFLDSKPEKIKSGVRLAKIMGGKARRIRENVAHYISEKTEKSQELRVVHNVIKKLLVHDMTPEQFADMYAQTLVYGLFVARYHDKTPETFSRSEARDLVPASNPLLRHFFDHIAGADFDKRLSMITNELCEIFSVADVRKIMEQYYSKTNLWGETEESPDPVIHFYEDFLKEYDSKQRVKLGAFYTPLPVVRFIVRSIDNILKEKFDLLDGLASTEKIEITKKVQAQKRKELVHQVQILDPATGTGTFLNEVIRQVYKKFEGQEGRWSSYVDLDLLPRLHGFELMMAPYTIAHLKLGITLRDMGYTNFSQRLGVYLTNSLEEGYKIEGTLFETIGFTNSLADEAIEASKIKNEKPIMVILGNPPYSGESNNNFEYANKLVNKYKFEPGGIEKLKEKNPKWLNDDYVKFIALSEELIEKNKEGILGFITNHSYLDNPTFRGMRWRLTQTFDEIYILDLHGNMKKKEVAPDGGKDENVFAIQQGVSIIIGVKLKSKGRKKEAKVFTSEIYGKRADKFNFLEKGDIKYAQIKLDPKQYYFVNKNTAGKEDYEKGFMINDLFKVSNVGVVTSADSVLTGFSKHELMMNLHEAKENKKGSKNLIKRLENESMDESKIILESYRPMDFRYLYYEPKVIERSRFDVMQHMLSNKNIGLVYKRGDVEVNSSPIFVSQNLIDFRSWSRPGMQGGDFISPLYIFHSDGSKTQNFDENIFNKIKEKLKNKSEPEDILDYIYAALNSKKYREKYKEFLKNDFPRVPYPADDETFWKLVKEGKELRELHLMESPKLREFITIFPENGSNIVEKIKYENGKVFINETQYFGNVPEIAWNFYIGGYQPAQKWLKDRKGRALSNEELEHYQKMIVALVETDRIMEEIDKIIDK